MNGETEEQNNRESRRDGDEPW